MTHISPSRRGGQSLPPLFLLRVCQSTSLLDLSFWAALPHCEAETLGRKVTRPPNSSRDGRVNNGASHSFLPFGADGRLREGEVVTAMDGKLVFLPVSSQCILFPRLRDPSLSVRRYLMVTFAGIVYLQSPDLCRVCRPLVCELKFSNLLHLEFERASSRSLAPHTSFFSPLLKG